MIAATAIWGCYLMGTYASGWMSWVRWTMLVGGVLGAAVLAMSGGAFQRFAVAAALIGSLSALGGTTAYTIATVATPHTGSTPASGPASVSRGGFGGMGGGMGQPPGGTSQGTQGGQTGQPGSNEQSTTPDLTSLLDSTTTRWSAAVIGSQSAADYILSTNTAVMAIGGWSGSDDSPTLEQFKSYVASGEITYFLAGGDGRGVGFGGQGGGNSSASEITAWVEANFSSTTVGGVTVYDLTSSK
jgi:hypothetical protein